MRLKPVTWKLKPLPSTKSIDPKLKWSQPLANQRRYKLKPYLYYTFNDNKKEELLTVLSVEQLDKDKTVVWRGRYVYHLKLTNNNLLKNERLLNSKVKKIYKEQLKRTVC